MKNNGLYSLFVEELENMYSSEHQIVNNLPKLIQAASYPELKEALSNHYKETQYQVTRIEKIFSILGIEYSEKTCGAMEAILREATDLLRVKTKSATLDAAIIYAAQKVEHYEIASYGTLKSFAKHLDLNSDIIDLIQETLDEEGAANKKLTKIADGTIFASGVNKEAAGLAETGRKYHKK